MSWTKAILTAAVTLWLAAIIVMVLRTQVISRAALERLEARIIILEMKTLVVPHYHPPIVPQDPPSDGFLHVATNPLYRTPQWSVTITSQYVRAVAGGGK